MPYPRNQFGVPQFPENDARRLFVLLAAIELLERPSVTAISDLTGQDKEIIDAEIMKLHNEFDVAIQKVGDVFIIESWGDLLNRDAVQRFLSPS